MSKKIIRIAHPLPREKQLVKEAPASADVGASLFEGKSIRENMISMLAYSGFSYKLLPDSTAVFFL